MKVQCSSTARQCGLTEVKVGNLCKNSHQLLVTCGCGCYVIKGVEIRPAGGKFQVYQNVLGVWIGSQYIGKGLWTNDY